MITEDSMGLTERFHVPSRAELAQAAPQNVPQDAVQVVNRALERTYGGGFDLSMVGSVEPVEGALLWDHMRAILKHWGVWPTKHALVIATAWAAHTWLVDNDKRLLLSATPRLGLIAPQQNGKTRLQRITGGLSRDFLGPAVGVVTAPGVRNALRKGHTLGLDEAHRIFLGRRSDLIGILCGGYTPDSVTLDGLAGEDNGSEIFGPVIIGAQPSLMKSRFAEEITDLFERMFVILPQAPPRHDEQGNRIIIPQLDEDYELAVSTTREALAIWAAAATIDQKPLWNIHSLTTELDSRSYEITVPLCAAADRAPDYRFEEEDPRRWRWSIAVREAACAFKLGTENTQDLMGKIRDSLEKLEPGTERME